MRLTGESRRTWWLALLAAWLLVGTLTVWNTLAERDYLAMAGRLGLRGAPEANTPLRQIWPDFASDAETWVRHALTVSEQGGGRLRWTDIDNAPIGREMDWNSAWAWLISRGGLAWHAITGEPLALATERWAFWQNLPVFLILMVAFSSWIARRAGAGAGVVVALAMLGNEKFFEGFLPAYPDHHGLLTASVFGLVAGIWFSGGGWWKAQSPDLPPLLATSASPASDSALRATLPASARAARSAAVFSALSGAAGMWISAASVVPGIAIVGMAGLAAALAQGRALRAIGAQFDAGVWRLWGRVGAALSFLAYLAEFFPHHLGFRLECNHPLYALAWLGGGELVAQAVERWLGPPGICWSGWPRLLLPAALVLAAPLVICLGGPAVFLVSDPFLWQLHAGISEFRTVFQHLERIRSSQGGQDAARLAFLSISPLSLLLLPLAPSLGLRGSKRAMGAFAIAGLLLLPIVAWLLGASPGIAGPIAAKAWHLLADPRPWRRLGGIEKTGVVLTVGGLAAWGLAWLGRSWEPRRFSLGLALALALGFTAMGCWQMHWMLNAAGPQICLVLALLASATDDGSILPGLVWGALVLLQGALLSIRSPALGWSVVAFGAALIPVFRHWRGQPNARRWTATVAAAALLFLPSAVGRIADLDALMAARTVLQDDAQQPLYRDLAAALRATQPTGDIVLLASPDASTGIGYYGRFKTLGTLYWENTAGLKAAAAIFSATNDREAETLIRARGVTHIEVDSRAEMLREFYEIAHPGAGPDEWNRSFGYRLLVAQDVPPWLQAIPYQVPADLAAFGGTVRLYQVNFQQSSAEATYNLATAEAKAGRGPEADRLFDAVIALTPQAPEPWARKGEIALKRGDLAAAAEDQRRAIALSPADGRAALSAAAGVLFFQKGAPAQALGFFRDSLDARFDPAVANNLAWVLATGRSADLRSAAGALKFARQAVAADPGNSTYLDTLGAAQAENGQWQAAAQSAQRALDLVRAAGNAALVSQIELRLADYRNHQPWRQ